MAASKTLTFRILADDGDALKSFGGLAKSAKRDMKKVAEALDDGRTAGKKLADALMADADAIEAELRGIESAAAKMSASLESELRGTSVDKLVLDLRKAGLTFEEIEADAEGLAQAVKRLDDVQLSRVRSEVAGIDDGMRGVAKTTDKSRSVMANFAGNATQDLPGVTGAFGAMNVAVGQFAEYASEGDIKLKNLVATAGLMGAASVGFLAIAQGAKQASRRAEELVGWIEDVKSGTAEMAMQGLTDAFLAQLLDGKDAFEELAKSNLAAARRLRELMVVQGVEQGVIDLLTSKIVEQEARQRQAAETEKLYGDAAEVAAGQVDQFGEVIDDGPAKFARASHAAGEYAATLSQEVVHEWERVALAESSAERALREYDAAWDAIFGEIDAEQALMDLHDAFAEVADVAVVAGETTEEAMRRQRREILAAKEATATYAKEILEIPDEQTTVILAMLDAGQVSAVEQQLAILARNRNIQLNLIARNDGIYGTGNRAAGGDATPGRAYNVDELGRGEVFVPNTRGRIIPLGNAGAPTGGTTVIKLMLDGRQITEVVHEGLLRKQRRVPLGING